MSQKLAVIDGRICRVLKTEAHGPDLSKVSIVTGTRTRRAVAGKRPGPKWRPDPSGDKRRWVSYSDRVEDTIISNKDLLPGLLWPEGWEEFGKSPLELVQAVSQFMKRAMDAGGARAQRTRPDINPATITPLFKREGLPMPTEKELDVALFSAWEKLNPREKMKKARAAKGGGRTIIPVRAVKKGAFGDAIPEGVELREGHFWSSALGTEIEDNEDGRLMHQAATDQGWPPEMLEGAKKSRRGLKGFTLRYAVKNEYKLETHGGPEPKPPELTMPLSDPEPEQKIEESSDDDEDIENEGKSDTNPTDQNEEKSEENQTEDSSSSDQSSDEGEE